MCSSIDAVYIGLITPLHYKWTKAALLANKHVLVEKPIAMNADEAEELASIANERNLVLMEGYHYRYHPSALRWKQIAQQEIGSVQSVEARFTMFDPKTLKAAFSGAGRSKATEEEGESAEQTHLRVKLLDRWCYCVDMIRFVTEPDARRAGSGAARATTAAANIRVTSSVVPLHGTIAATMIVSTNANQTSTKNVVAASFIARKDVMEFDWGVTVTGTCIQVVPRQ